MVLVARDPHPYYITRRCTLGHNFPKQLAITLRDAAKIKFFVETGTFKGATSTWAAAHFEKVYTIEAYRPRFEKTAAALALYPNIVSIFGDSRVKLAEVLEQISSPAIIWLDAHWINDSPVDAKGECPLLEELQAINEHAFSDDHIILIDDARLFTQPPPHPHQAGDWPRLSTFINKIGTGRRVIKIDHDMIMSVPEKYKSLLNGAWY